MNVEDPEGIIKKISELKQEQYQWDNWPLYPELVAKLRAADLKQEMLLNGEEQWFHGTREAIPDFSRGGEVYLTDSSTEAAGYAQGKHLGGTGGEQPRVYSVAAKRGKTLNIDELIDEEIMNGGDIEVALDAGIAQARAEGARYVEYRHPSFDGEADQNVRISLYPAEDLRVTNQPTKKRGGVLFQDDFELKAETPAEAKARDDEAVAAAKRKMVQEKEGAKGPVFTVDQADLFNTQRTLFQSSDEIYARAYAQKEGLLNSILAYVRSGKVDIQDYQYLHDQPLSMIERFAAKNGIPQGVLFQSDKPDTWYYSALARSIDSSQTKQAPAKGWKDSIKGMVAKGEVKADEVKWSGIEEFLDAQEGKVSKEQVADFLKRGGVKVEEVTLGVADTATETAYASAKEAVDVSERKLSDQTKDLMKIDRGNLSWWAFDEANGDAAATQKIDALGLSEEARQTVRDYGIAREALSQAARAREISKQGNAKFESYQLPGGENYRELLLTLPTSATKSEEGRALRIQQLQDEIDALYKEPFGEERNRKIANAETLVAMVKKDNVDRGESFKSYHFDQPNLFAHVRFNERTDAEGKKILFIEEIQSDWAQKGRTEGFQGQQKSNHTVEQDPVTVGSDLPLWLVKDAEGNTVNFSNSREGAQRWADAYDKEGFGGKVPNAPFVGKTDAWTALAMKRMIRYAAEKGFDKVSWTTGEQQVERYTSGLRQAVDSIDWVKTKDGIQIVGYKTDKGRDTDIRRKVVDTTESENALSDAIGKSMAEKIIKDPNQTGTIEGDDITISDTGMAGYYDRIVPKVANDVLKKLGGGRVEDVRTSIGYKDVEGGGYRVSVDGEHQDVDTLESAKDIAERTGGTIEKLGGVVIQQGFTITPEMRAKAMEGMPLFQKTGQERAGEHLGSYSVAENLITTFEKANKSTIVHELGHSWLEEMKFDAARPNAPPQIKADWDTIRSEFAIGSDNEISTASHELFARTFERFMGEGKAPSIGLRGVFERFKTWMLEVYSDIKNIGLEINPEVRGVFDRMLATDQEIADARELGVPRAYVDEARTATAARIVQPIQEGRKIDPGFKAEQISMEPYADELPKGPGEAPDSSHINYKYINSPMDVKLTMQRMAEIDQANIQKQRGGTAGVKSWGDSNAEQARYLNDIMGGSEDTLRILSPRDSSAPGQDVRLGIMKKLLIGSVKDSARLRDVILEHRLDATVRQQLEFMGSIERMRMIHAEFLGERAAFGRGMNALKDVTEGSGEIGRILDVIGYGEAAARELFQSQRTPAEEQAYMKARLDEIMQNYKGKTVLDIAMLYKEIGTIKGSIKFAKEVTRATTWEMIVEGWKAGLLSGPVTHTTNFFGTGTFQFMRAPVDALASIIGMARGASIGTGESDRASMSESVARITGMIGGIQDAAKVAYHEFKADDATGKTESYREAIPGRLGHIIRIPLRMMSAEDAFVKTMYKRGELTTLAMRQAFNENLNPGAPDFSKRVMELRDNPPPDMELAADNAATRMTFNMPLGEKGRALQSFVAKWNLQWMIPFIRTPINITKEVARMSPLAPMVGEWRAAIAKGGIERDRAIAEAVLGSGIMAITIGMAFNGTITGSGSPDSGKNRAKEGVEQRYSIKIGDTYYEYSRIQPHGTLVGMAADMADIWDHMTDEEKDKVPKLMATAFANAVTNQTFLQGISNFINAMSDPTRFFPSYANRMAASLVPNIIAQPTAMADPYTRETNGMLDAIMARIPGMREDLTPRRDWLGEPVQSAERVGVVMPIRTMEQTQDKVRLEAARLDISVSAAPRKTHIGKGTGKLGDVELTPQERDKFAELGGQMTHNVLTNIVNNPGWDQIPDLIKQRIFRNVITASHRYAAAMVLPPDKRQAYIQSITERMQQELQPEGAQP